MFYKTEEVYWESKRSLLSEPEESLMYVLNIWMYVSNIWRAVDPCDIRRPLYVELIEVVNKINRETEQPSSLSSLKEWIAHKFDWLTLALVYASN